MLFRQISDDTLAQYAYLVGCQRTGEALVIDPERDVDRYLAIAAEEGLRITAVTETHIHADFLSGAREFAERGVRVYLSDEGGPDWSYGWPELGPYEVVLLKDGDTFRVGNVEIRAVFTPGHTPEHLSFMVTDLGGGADEPMGLASGDFVFVGDTGRPDLLESAAGVEGAMEEGAAALYQSVQRFLELPDYLQVWPGHGAGSACGKALGAVPETTVGYERRFSPALSAAQVGKDAFVDYVLDGQPEPPPYFGRMKRLNRDGPPLIGQVPVVSRSDPGDLDSLIGDPDVVLVDAREDRSEFMAGHVPGALFAPLDKSFATVTGSFIEADSTVYLIVEPTDVDTAVRSLVRIGLDRIGGYLTPDDVRVWVDGGGRLARIEEIDMLEVEGLRSDSGYAVLDVRRSAEFREGHVPDALNVAHTRLAADSNALPSESRLLVHCRTGNRSAAAAAFLAHRGFDVVYVNGAFERWAEQYGSGHTEGASV